MKRRQHGRLAAVARIRPRIRFPQEGVVLAYPRIQPRGLKRKKRAIVGMSIAGTSWHPRPGLKVLMLIDTKKLFKQQSCWMSGRTFAGVSKMSTVIPTKTQGIG